MEFHSKKDLEELRKNINKDDDLKLYAVYKNLAYPVFMIKSISKKYVYWDDDSRHPYPSASADYSLFDNQSEAWRFWKKLYEDKKKQTLKEYEENMKRLSKAEAILEQCSIDNPEYFI